MVQLDGSQSSDRQGRTLSYRWQQLAGLEVSLQNANSPQASFVVPEIADGTMLTFGLQVTAEDGTASAIDTVTVTARRCVAEVCNGGDDDCDGTIDNEPADEGGTCETGHGDPGCATGMLRCYAGRLRCLPEDLGCLSQGCAGDQNCDDGIWCNGAERCTEDWVCPSGEPLAGRAASAAMKARTVAWRFRIALPIRCAIRLRIRHGWRWARRRWTWAM